MNWPFGLLRPNAYSVLCMDCPWQFQSYNTAGVPQTADQQHYQTMTVQEIARLPVDQLARPDCALFMWCMSSHTPQCYALARNWGFTFSTKAFSWVKLNKNAIADEKLCGDETAYFMGMGHTSRRNTEDCWLFTRGKPERTLIMKDGKMKRDQSVRELIVEPLREHSRKPGETYDRIERLYQGPYAELFSRNTRAGWSSWGNEVGKYQ